jgi:hypothetical protein
MKLKKKLKNQQKKSESTRVNSPTLWPWAYDLDNPIEKKSGKKKIKTNYKKIKYWMMKLKKKIILEKDLKKTEVNLC